LNLIVRIVVFSSKAVRVVLLLITGAALIVAVPARAGWLPCRKYHNFYCPPRKPSYIADSPVPSYFLPTWVRPIPLPHGEPVSFVQEQPTGILPTPRVQKEQPEKTPLKQEKQEKQEKQDKQDKK
jgi:hypothetical protein